VILGLHYECLKMCSICLNIVRSFSVNESGKESENESESLVMNKVKFLIMHNINRKISLLHMFFLIYKISLLHIFLLYI
jgi:hypothetical protein